MSKTPQLPGLSTTAEQPTPDSLAVGQTATEFSKTDLQRTWKERVIHDNNDFIVGIAPSSRTAISGTGKTTLAVKLAEHFDQTSRGFVARDKAALDAGTVANDLIPDLEARSAVVFDEAQGTLGDDGVDSRRGMASSVIDMARAAAQFRKRQHTLLIVTQSTSWIDSRMMELLDRLILIQEKNARKGYARAVVFDQYKRDLPGGDQSTRTPAIEEITWGACDPDNRNYAELDRMKESSGGEGGEEDEDGGKNKQKQLAKAAKAYYDDGLPWRKIDKGNEELDWPAYSSEWYRTRISDA
jgi:hypothetical protein